MILDEKRVLLLLIGALVFSTFGVCNSEREIKDEERVLLEILHDTGESLVIKNDLIFSIKGVFLKDKKIKEISMGFDYPGRCDIEVSRRLLLAATKELLKNLNANKAIAKSCLRYPLEVSDLDVSIYFSSNNAVPSSPNIAVANLNNGNLYYYIEKNKKHELMETYKDAQMMARVVNKNPQIECPLEDYCKSVSIVINPRDNGVTRDTIYEDEICLLRIMDMKKSAAKAKVFDVLNNDKVIEN